MNNLLTQWLLLAGSFVVSSATRVLASVEDEEVVDEDMELVREL